jgi:TPR repeat protein
MARGNEDVEERRSFLDALARAVPDQSALTRAERAYEQEDYAVAFDQFEPLAVAGDAVAQLYLGELYRGGHGTEADPVRAQMWLSLAAERLPAGADRERATAERDAVAQQLTGVQLSEARRRAREWTPSAS